MTMTFQVLFGNPKLEFRFLSAESLSKSSKFLKLDFKQILKQLLSFPDTFLVQARL